MADDENITTVKMCFSALRHQLQNSSFVKGDHGTPTIVDLPGVDTQRENDFAVLCSIASKICRKASTVMLLIARHFQHNRGEVTVCRILEQSLLPEHQFLIVVNQMDIDSAAFRKAKREPQVTLIPK